MRDPGDGPEAETRPDAPPARRSAPTDRPSSTALGDRFALGEELGHGGMGRVIAATDRVLSREVAIKQVLADDNTLLARFEREMRITAQLEHPSIIPLHDGGRDRNGRPFYVMRRLRGEQLSDRVAKYKTARDRLALVPNVLAAVDAAAFAHARRIIHRDIKPWNILIGDFGETMLIDWGLARTLDEPDDGPQAVPTGEHRPPDDNLTRAGHVFGTPGYMAPEQARGEPADERSDVFALGATLQHVLTGSTTLEGNSATQWIERAQNGTLEPAAMPDEVPRELVAIVEKATAADAAARYPHAGELARDLRAFLAGQLVAAHHYTLREMVARFLRKHRIAIAIAAIAAIGFAVFAVISVRNVVEERDRADEERANAVRERAVADDRAEVMLLERASTLARTDPTRAVALLRKIPPTSPHLRRARDIAESAAAAGVEHGVSTDIGSVNALVFTADGKSLIAAGEHDGVHVIDLATVTIKKWPLPGRASNHLLLLDDERLLINTQKPPGLHLLNLRTGERRTLGEVDISALWRMDDDRIRYFSGSRNRKVVDLVLKTGETTTIATDVDDAVQLEPDRLVLSNSKSVRLLAGDRTVELTTDTQLTNTPIVPSPDRSRFVVQGARLLVEFDRDGAELGRWSLLGAVPAYRGNDLHATNLDGALLRLGATAFTVGRVPPQTIPRHSSARFIALASLSAGGVIVFDALGSHTISRDPSETQTLAFAGPRFAVGTRAGMVRWGDLRHAIPDHIPIAAGFAPCWATPTRIYATTSSQLFEYDRITGEKLRTIEIPPLTFGCEGIVGDKLIADVDSKTTIADLRTGKAITYPDRGHLDLDAKRLVIRRGRALLEIDIETGSDRVLTTLPDELVYWATVGRWAFAATRTTLYRYDRDTHAVASIPATFEVESPSPDGTFAFTRVGKLYKWDGIALRLLHALPAGRAIAISNRDGVISLRYDNGTMWFVTDAGITNRAPPGHSSPAGFGPRQQFVRLVMSQRIVRHYLATGETTTYDLPAVHARTLTGSGSIMMTSHNRIAILDELVPGDPFELHRWIDRATNAVIDETTGALAWREAR